MTTELKGAEKELDSLIRKLHAVPQSGNAGGATTGGNFQEAFGSRVFGSAFSGGAAGGFLGGVAGGAALAGISATKSAVSGLLGEVEDLSVESVRLSANFEATVQGLAVFAGGTQHAKNELAEMDKIARDATGLRLIPAEEGYQRLRALGFQADLTQKFVKGLANQKLLSNSDEGAIDRVIVNLTQIKANSKDAARDIKEIIKAVPSISGVFKDTFGTANTSELKKILESNPDKFFNDFAAGLANAKQAQGGLNNSVGKFQDTIIELERGFGTPLLDPLKKDVQDLDNYLRRNQKTVEAWGQSVADAVRGASEAFVESRGEAKGASFARRLLLGIGTGGVSEGIIGSFNTFSEIGRQAREKQEEEERRKKFTEGLANGVNFEGAKFKLDPLTNTLQKIGEAVKNTPSLADELEIEKAIKKAEQFLELTNRISVAGVEQNLELNKAIAVRDARGDTLKIARETAALEINALREQINLSNKLASDKTRNLSSDDFKDGKGLLIARENAANVAKLENQILLTRINLQKQQNDEVEKAKLKVKELEKQYLSTFDSLFQKSGSNNPFVTVFSEADRSLKELRENIKGLPPELQAVAVKIQQQFNLRKLLEAGVDNKLSSFDFRSEAQNFRNPFDGDKQKKDQEEFITGFLRNNPNYLYLQNKTALDDDERGKILKRFAPSALNETPADRLNKNLDDKFNLLYKPGQTAEQLAIADKRFISATAGANPLDLTKDLREKAAVVREREAVREERYQQDAIALYRQQSEYQKAIAANTLKQVEIAGKVGTKAIELTLKNESDAAAQLQPAATSADTQNAYYDENNSNYRIGDTHKAGSLYKR